MTKRTHSAALAPVLLAGFLAAGPMPQPAHARTRAHGDISGRAATSRVSLGLSRACLTAPAKAILAEIEAKFGTMRLVSTCRPGATIAGSGRPSRHASGNAVDFDAGARKAEVVAWLIANHRKGGTMTYSDMSHVHVDIGPHFVALAANSHTGAGRQHARRQTRYASSEGRRQHRHRSYAGEHRSHRSTRVARADWSGERMSLGARRRHD